MTREQLLKELVERFQAALGDELVCVVLFGSAAAGDFHEKVSDLNVLCVLKQVGMAELEMAYQPVDWWLKRKQAAPTVLSLEELENARDAFAIEFRDIRDAYEVLHGEDVIAAIEVDPAHHRHQLEHEIRSRLLRLRERYLALQRERQQVIDLMVQSLSTFATLFRHALILAGEKPPVRKREIFQAAAERFGISAAPFGSLLDVREGSRRLDDREIRPLFEGYLAEITRCAEIIDQL
jgi:predicted nucleotidyltransferase